MMSMPLLICMALLTAFEVIYILWSWDKHWLKAALGQKIWLDIFFSLGTTVFFAITGTISGMVIAAFSGFVFSMSLLLAAKTVGYRKKELINGTKQWVDYAPVWNKTDILAKVKTRLSDVMGTEKTAA